MNLRMSLDLFEIAIAVASVIFGFHALWDYCRARTRLASPSLIASQSLLGMFFVARLTDLLLRQPQDALEMMQILLLFIAAEVTLVMLAIYYRRSYRRSKDNNGGFSPRAK